MQLYCGGRSGPQRGRAADGARYIELDGSYQEPGQRLTPFTAPRSTPDSCERQTEYFWMCVVDASSSDVALSAASDCETIVMHAQKRGDMNVFVEIASATGFLPMLNNVHGVNTVFAPTDDAWLKYTEKLGQNGELPDMLTLATLMQYHFVPGQTIKTVDFEAEKIIPTALANNFVTVKPADGGSSWKLMDMNNKRAVITGANIPLCKAVMHVLGSVLEFAPPVEA